MLRPISRRSLPAWQEAVLLLTIAVVLAICLKTFVAQAFYIPSASMRPTLVENDRILVEKVSYWGSAQPERGDVVVFGDPDDWLGEDGRRKSGPVTRALEKFGLYPAGGHLVKRVIGIGGDRVRCCDDRGRITVNGRALDEGAYLPDGTEPSASRFDVQVPAQHLWVMGDNRGNSADSRAHLGEPGGGFVPDDLVVGKVWALVWPLSRFKVVHRPGTFAEIPDS